MSPTPYCFSPATCPTGSRARRWWWMGVVWPDPVALSLFQARHPDAPRFHQRGERSRAAPTTPFLDARRNPPVSWLANYVSHPLPSKVNMRKHSACVCLLLVVTLALISSHFLSAQQSSAPAL